jgi:tetratricopeptide (TPR) repeat protein
MSISLRLLFLAAFAWVGFVILSEAHDQAKLDQPDNSKVALLFAGAILDGLVVASIVAFLIVPSLGDIVGGYFFNPGTKIEKDPHSDAISKLARGDPEGAIQSYEQILEQDPTDTLAISEIARICCRDLEDTARGAAVLEQALQGEWPLEQSSFLANRLADIYLLQHDPMRARQLIIQIATSLEGTRFAANAQHRLREIDRTIETGLPAPVPEEE